MKGFGSVYKKTWLGIIIALMIFCHVNYAAAQDADTWQHELTIYGWYAGIDGDVQFPGPLGSGSDFTVDASDILSNLNMIFMGGWQSKRNKWSFVADVVYMDVGDSVNQIVTPGSSGVPLNASLDLDISTWLLNGGVGYDVVQTERATLAVVGGVRYLTIDVDVKADFQGPGVEESDSEGLLDGIIGVSGSFNFNDNWYLPFHADIGAGGSDLSWQLFAAIGYRFSWGDVRLGYRYLSYDLDDDFIMQDMDLSGPLLGVGFRF
jgi:hypothetical protein